MCARARKRRRDASYDLSDSEIEHLNNIILKQHNIARLDIPVNNAPGMSLSERLCDLSCDTSGTLWLQRGFRFDHVPQRLSADVFHHHVISVAFGAEVNDADDTRMVELCKRLGFAPKSAA